MKILLRPTQKGKKVSNQLRRYFRRTRWIGVIFFLIFGSNGRSETMGLPACSFVAEQGLTKGVSVLVSKIAERPGLICARVTNGQESIIYFGYGDIKLERLWFGILWSASLHLKDFFWRDQKFVPYVLLGLKPGEVRDHHLAIDYEGVPTGRYRVRFCYQVDPEEKEQSCVYSEAISFP